MTRTALRRAVPARLEGAILQWRDNPGAPLARELRRAGFYRLPDCERGVERIVLVGHRVVLKTTAAWHTDITSHPRFRRSRTLAPAIVVAPGVIAQPRGIVMRKFRRGGGPRVERLYQKMKRAALVVHRYYNIGDSHNGNYALFPDGTVRCIDY